MNAPIESHRCHACSAAIDGTPVRKQHSMLDETVYFHAACWAEIERERAADRARLIQVWRTNMAGFEFKNVPEWPWARVNASEFAARVKPKLQAFARKYELAQGSVILAGTTGVGKTSALLATVHRLRDIAIAEALAQEPGSPPTPTLRTWRGLVWTYGVDLAMARKKHPLGEGDPELIVDAIRAPILVIDELGFEPQLDTTIYEIIDARYRNELPTLITTGLREAEFRQRYGDACWRKLSERGVVVQEWSK